MVQATYPLNRKIRMSNMTVQCVPIKREKKEGTSNLSIKHENQDTSISNVRP